MTSPNPLTELADRVQSFWSDDFDMDLPKIFPDALRLLGELASVELATVGTPDKNGRLNHPSVWNGDHGTLAFFGFNNPARDTFYCAPGSIEVRCTAWEMFRDAWAHSYIVHIERRPIWNTCDLWPLFETIMFDIRGWPNGERSPGLARVKALGSYVEAIRKFKAIVERYPDVLARARAAAESSHG